MKIQIAATLASILIAALPGCGLPPRRPAVPPSVEQPANLAAVYAGLSAGGGRVYRLDPQASMIRIYAFRGGNARKAGHNHVLSTSEFSGFLYVPAAGPAQARFDLEFRLDRLELDAPANRAALGDAFKTPLSKESIADTRTHMLSAANLQAEQFPYLRVRSLQIAGESPKFAAKVQIELHGQNRDLWVPVAVAWLPDRMTASGSFVLRQSDFGIKPYSVLGGLIAVQDETIVEFTLVGL